MWNMELPGRRQRETTEKLCACSERAHVEGLNTRVRIRGR